jgi:predicted nucleic acid-binding protein
MDATLLGVVLDSSEQAAQGINLPLADLIIGATAVELGYAVATGNLRDFKRIPGLRVVEV